MVGANTPEARAKDFFLYAGGVAAVVIAIAVVVAVVRSASSGNASDPKGAARAAGSTSTTAGGKPVDGSTTTTSKPADIFPEDRVAYITSDGRVLSGTGAGAPNQVADGAAVDAAGQGSLAVSPTGDLIAFVRRDGAVVTVPVDGGDVKVLATDAWMRSVGSDAFLAWDPTSARLSYLATGTQDMVAPRTGQQEPPSMEGAFRVPLPEGTLGAVAKIVDRNGELINRLGDPSLRSVSGITYSTTDDLILIESTVPATGQPYTVATANSTASEIKGTVLSADDPAFSPDGNFILAVGPRPGGQSELIRISTENFSRAVLSSSERICHPRVSPDSTRIVYGAGPGCSKLMLVSSRGGKPVEITPPDRPNQTFATATVDWTQDGHFVVFPQCVDKDDKTSCSGAVSFFDPDRSVLVNGPKASTVTAVARPLIQDMTVHVAMAGPIEYQGKFLVDTKSQAELTDVSKTASIVDVVLSDGDRSLTMKVDVNTTRQFSSGTMTIVDPEAGINRTFLITGSASLIGMRVASLSGIWISNAELPFATGEFRISVLRGT